MKRLSFLLEAYKVFKEEIISSVHSVINRCLQDITIFRNRLSIFSSGSGRRIFKISTHHLRLAVMLLGTIVTICSVTQITWAQSTKEIPLLFIMLEIGPGSGQDFDRSRMLDYVDHEVDYVEYLRKTITGTSPQDRIYSTDYLHDLADGTGPQNRIYFTDVIDYAEGYTTDPGLLAAKKDFPLGKGDDFALHAKGIITVPQSQQGPWTIGIRSDDGARVRIDGKTILDNDGLHGPSDRFSTVDLNMGLHVIELVYFNLRNTPGMVELFAAKGKDMPLGSNFELIGANSATSLSVSGGGFKVSQRFSRDDLKSLTDADVLLRSAIHNVIDYFLENSYGALRFVPATGGDLDGLPDGIASRPDTSSSGVPIWLPLELSNLEVRAEEKRRRAMEAADPFFDFAFYDAVENGGNGDGVLDPDELVVVVITGQPDGDSPCGNCRIPKNVTTLKLDGIYVNKDFLVAGVTQWCGWITLVHEISHLLEHQLSINAALDLYQLDNAIPTTDGDLRPYDVMASSEYNRYTTHHNPWTKMQYGWLTPRIVDSTGVYVLKPIETTPDVLRINKPNNTLEYLLIENRWKANSYDSAALHTDFPGVPPVNPPRWEFRPDDGIPENGLAVYHVNENRFPNFTGGDYSSPQFIRRLRPSMGRQVWQGKELFRDHSWSDGTPMNLMVCASTPGAQVSADIRFAGTDDPFDDQLPPGEPRNDTRANATLLELQQGAIPPSIDLDLPWRVNYGGRSINNHQPNLNIDTSTDVDFFKIVVDLAGFAYSPELGSECPTDFGSEVEGFSVMRRRGSIRIALYPKLAGPFSLELTDAAGVSLPTQPFIDQWANSWSTGIEIDCPTTNLPSWPDTAGQGVLFARVSNPSKTCNFYELHVEYREAEVFAVDRDAFPHPVWDLEDVKILWPRPDPTHLSFPIDPKQCASLPCSPQPDRLVFVWPETSDFKLDIDIVDKKQLTFSLFGPTGVLCDENHIQGEGQITVPNLRAGAYQICVSSKSAPVFYSVKLSRSY